MGIGNLTSIIPQASQLIAPFFIVVEVEVSLFQLFIANNIPINEPSLIHSFIYLLPTSSEIVAIML